MRLLCGIDDSPEGRHAAVVAAHLSAALGTDATRVERDGMRLLRLAALAGERTCDMLIAGYVPPRRVLGVRLGATPEQIATRARRPTMLAGPRCAPRDGRRIVLGYDVADPLSPAAAVAGRLAAALGASLVLAPAAPEAGATRQTGWQLYDAGRRVEEMVREAAGSPIEVELVTRQRTPLPVIATHQEASFVVLDGGPRRRRESHATRLLEHGRWPVLVVPRDAPVPA
jgi:nucleotide-binding universal stress UspA family protein